MAKAIIFISIALVYTLVSTQVNCQDDWFGSLAKRTDSAQLKAEKAITHAKVSAVKKIQRSLLPFKESVQLMQDMINSESTKFAGRSREICAHARESLRKAVRGIDEAMSLNLKAPRSGRDGDDEEDPEATTAAYVVKTGGAPASGAKKKPGILDKLVSGVKGGIAFAAEGTKEFLQAVRPVGEKGVAIAVDIANAYEKAAESIVTSMAEMG